MNAFYEHHKNSIRFGYRCFDRILLNGLIQPFQQPERVVGFFSTYRHLHPGSMVQTCARCHSAGVGSASTALCQRDRRVFPRRCRLSAGGCELFELMRAHDLEGIVAKRLADPYGPRVRWLKIKNQDYTQKEGRSDLFNGPRSAR